MDDLSLAATINLKKNLVKNPDPNPPRPLPYHCRTGHTLPDEKNVVNQQFQDLTEFANEHQMQINVKKTKAMLFNTRRTVDFMPEIKSENGECLEVVEEYKLIGVKIQSDLGWAKNTSFLCSKGYSKLWILRNLKKMGTEQSLLVDVYYKQCRSVLEMAVPVWSAGLTKSESNQIERVQKTAVAIILGENHKSYNRSLKTLGMKTLEERRKDLCLAFAKKSFQNEKFKNWFCESSECVEEVKPVNTRTKRYRRSPLRPTVSDKSSQ